ncbi:MAG: porin [Planctomycetota bacterium]|nr:porin [Planctomycetota bacterium]
MNKFVLGALALTMATTPALATETSWSTTDRDLAGLSTSLTQGATGVSVSGFLRSSYASSSDIQVGGDDLGGFSIDDAQIWVNGSVGDFSVVVQSEASSSSNTIGDVGTTGALGLLDAYASWKATEQLKVQLGQFRPAFLGSSLRNENNLLFINRSALGAEYAFRDQGVQLSGAFGMINFAVYAQNGSDGAAKEMSYGFRVEATPMGTAANNEGVLGAADNASLTVGLGYLTNDGAVSDDISLGIDAAFTMGVFGVSAEIVDLDKGATLSLPGGVGNVSDATPFNAAASFAVMPDQLELAVRYEDFDDSDNTTAITIGANWYLQGHAAKWQANYVTVAADTSANEFDLIQVGLTVSI